MNKELEKSDLKEGEGICPGMLTSQDMGSDFHKSHPG